MGKLHTVTEKTSDRIRQITVTIAEAFCIFGTLIGVGVLGTQVNEAGGGRFAADSTLLTPNGPAFSIWSVIYSGLFAYTIWQWLPQNTTSPLARRTGYLAAGSMILNACWLLVVQQEWFWASVGIIIALLLTLVSLIWRTTTLTAANLTQRLVVNGTFGAYLGWVSVATLANITATLAGDGWPRTGFFATCCTLILLSVVLVVARTYLSWFGPRLSIYAAMAWGVAWIAQGRFFGEPKSVTVGLAATVVAALIVVCAVTSWQKRPLQRRSAKQKTRVV